jgi:hypothetical protein
MIRNLFVGHPPIRPQPDTLENSDSALKKAYHISMRRLTFIAAFVLAVSLGTASAQMRGGGHPGGAVGSRGFVRGGVSPRTGFATRSNFGPRFAPRTGFVTRFGFNPRFGPRFRAGCCVQFHHRRPVFFRDPFFGFPSRRQVLFVGGWPYYGGWDYPYFGSNSYDVSVQNEDYLEQRQLDADLDSLRNEVRTLREENERARDEERQRSASLERPREPGPETPATVLVFKDGRKIESRNYAIVGQTLWLFNESRATRFPISDLDLDATIKADDQRGIEFRLPRK